MYPQSVVWRIAYTEFVTCVAAYIIFKVYDNYPLWVFSTDLIRDICGLDFERVLGSRLNADELYRLLDVIKSTNLLNLNSNWTSQGRLESLSLSRRGPGFDCFYYNPWAKLVATAKEVRT